VLAAHSVQGRLFASKAVVSTVLGRSGPLRACTLINQQLSMVAARWRSLRPDLALALAPGMIAAAALAGGTRPGSAKMA
jgi:hypothetical protein